MTIPDRLITDSELVAMLPGGRTRKWLHARCREDGWPHMRIGRSYAFTAKHVRQILAQMERGGATATTTKAPRAPKDAPPNAGLPPRAVAGLKRRRRAQQSSAA